MILSQPITEPATRGLGLVILAALVASNSAGCGRRTESELRVEDIADTSTDYTGRPVAVSATVERIVNDRLFVIRGDALPSTKRMFVRLSRPARFTIREGERVRLVGRARRSRLLRAPILVSDRVDLVDAHPFASQGYQQRGLIGAVIVMSKIYSSAFIGHEIVLDNVPVVSVDGSIFRIGFAPHFVVSVACARDARCDEVSPGDRVVLHGTVLANTRSAKDSVFVEADEMTKLTGPPST